MNSKEHYDQIKEWFDEEILEHQMNILHDEGVYRHIRFNKPGDSTHLFNLTTFPNHLCISGDMGTFVFSRVEDMFRFFRNERDVINPSYWGEKLQSISTYGGYEKFNKDVFNEEVEQWFADYRENFDDEKLADKIWADIKEKVIDREGDDSFGWEDMRSAIDYVYIDDDDSDIRVENIFQDFWEHSCTRYEQNYIWCLWAIVHGIKMYDELKSEVQNG